MIIVLALALTAQPPDLTALPPLTDRNRFPPLQACSEAIHVNVIRWGFCKTQMQIDTNRANYWRREMYRADRNIEAWYQLLVAHGGLAEEEGGNDSEETCRNGLMVLRELIGEEAYQAGRMP